MDLAQLTKIAMAVVANLGPLVLAVEGIADVKGWSGPLKEDEFVKRFKAGLEVTEDIAGKNLLNDAAFESLLREAARAYIAVTNAIVKAQQLQDPEVA